MSFAQMLRDAGPVFWVLLVLSVYVLYLFLLKLQILNRLGQDPTLLLTRVHAALMQHNLSGAQRLAQQKHPVANVIRAGLDRVPTGRESVVAAMNEAAVIEEARLMQGLNNLATVAQVAPMLGLLGTVLGMIQAFEVFSRSAAPGAHQLAAGKRTNNREQKKIKKKRN
jgi:biopolymer transport protein ExbB